MSWPAMCQFSRKGGMLGLHGADMLQRHAVLPREAGRRFKYRDRGMDVRLTDDEVVEINMSNTAIRRLMVMLAREKFLQDLKSGMCD